MAALCKKMIMNTSEILKAQMFAAEAHKDQRRKGNGGSPYINHLIEVAYLVANVAMVKDTSILQAAILHDILEDTETTEEQLRSQFNEQVVSYVKFLTDDKSLSLDDRRKAQIKHINRASSELKVIKLADHCSNITSIPPSWNPERINSYRDWSARVAKLCFDASPELAKEYNRRFGENA